VKILGAADESEEDEYFDAVEDSSVTVKEVKLPRRPKRWYGVNHFSSSNQLNTSYHHIAVMKSLKGCRKVGYSAEYRVLDYWIFELINNLYGNK